MIFTLQDNTREEERETSRSPSIKTKASKNNHEKKPEPEPTSIPTVQPKMSDPLSLLSGLSSNPMAVSSIIQSDIPTGFMRPNFNPNFPTPPQFLPPNHPFPPGFPLQPRLPIPPPPTTLSAISQAQPGSISDTHRSSHSTNASETDSLDRSLSPSQMDTSTNADLGTTTNTPKISALSSLLEFGTLPSSNLGDIRPTVPAASPYPFPFVTPGPGAPFSPQAAAGMTSYFRPPFNAPLTTAVPSSSS
jgi:hypothetical protein